MSVQSFGNGAASAAGSNLVNAVLTTPQGQAAVATTAAVVVAAAPVVLTVAAVGAVAVGIGVAFGALTEWLES